MEFANWLGIAQPFLILFYETLLLFFINLNNLSSITMYVA